MTFKEMMIEKLKENVARRVANDSSLIRNVADAVLDDLDYADIASHLGICSSEVADEIDSSDVMSEIVDLLDMDDIRQEVINSCDMDEITGRVISMLPDTFMDDLAIKAAEEIMAEMD